MRRRWLTDLVAGIGTESSAATRLLVGVVFSLLGLVFATIMVKVLIGVAVAMIVLLGLAELTERIAFHRWAASQVSTPRPDLIDAASHRMDLAPLGMEVLDRATSVHLLTRLTGIDEPEAAGRLADDLGDLPLALEQAAAYISQNPTVDLVGYRRLLSEQPAKLLAATGADDRADRAISRVWHLTITAIRDRSPLSGRIFDVLAYLAPDNVPEALLAQLGDKSDRHQALTLLASYRMITRTGGDISVHRLVQAATRTSHAAAWLPWLRRWRRRRQPLNKAIATLAQSTPVEPSTNVDGWPQWTTLVNHIIAATSHLPRVHTDRTALYLLDGTAMYLQGQG